MAGRRVGPLGGGHRGGLLHGGGGAAPAGRRVEGSLGISDNWKMTVTDITMYVVSSIDDGPSTTVALVVMTKVRWNIGRQCNLGR